MNIKKLSLAIFSMTAIFGAYSSPLTPEAALARIQNSGSHRLPGAFATSPKLNAVIPSASGEAAIYAFESSVSDGFVLLSADDMAPAVLGYSTESNFDIDNLPPALNYWIEEYAKQIAVLQVYDNNMELGYSRLPEWPSISPLIQTRWDQGRPFNNLSPKKNGTTCKAGCVATAMGQVMKYHEFPERGEGRVAYKVDGISGNLKLDFSEVTFDWANMLDIYDWGKYSDKEANAVATLIQACGYSVEMTYGTASSGAAPSKLVNALISYFGYDPSLAYYHRSSYEYNDWASMVYENVSNGMPVLYDGLRDSGGSHCFVCDGYDGNGYFHFNWGWAGLSDGYFLLDALNPSAVGAGGDIGGYNFEQHAVMGIKPLQEGQTPGIPDMALTMRGFLQGSINGNNLNFSLSGDEYNGWELSNGHTGRFNGYIIVSTDDDPTFIPVEVPLDAIRNVYLERAHYYPYNVSRQPTVALAGLNLKEGTRYKFTFASQCTEIDGKEVPEEDIAVSPMLHKIGYANHVFVTKTAQGYEVETLPLARFDISNLQIVGGLYYGCDVASSAVITNNSDTQLSRGIGIVLEDASGKTRFNGDNIMLTLSPGETITYEWAYSLSASGNQTITQPTEFYMRLYDFSTGMYYPGDRIPVTMQPAPPKPQLDYSVTIDNATLKNGVYMVSDPNNIKVTLNLKVIDGYYNYPITLYTCEFIDAQTLATIFGTSFDGHLPAMNTDDEVSLSTIISFPDALLDMRYYIVPIYRYNGKAQWLTDNLTCFMVESAGISDITDDTESITVYNLQGIKVLESDNASDINTLGNGVYIVNGRKIAIRK